ncbi:MAG: hypothetical protein QXL19_05930 [Ignisphaera sp.]
MGLTIVRDNDYEVICDGKIVVINWRNRVTVFRLNMSEEEINKRLSLLPSEIALTVREVIKEATRSS